MRYTCSVCKKTLKKKRPVECGTCGGTGEVKKLLRWANCNLCRGSGTVGEFYCPKHPDAGTLFKFASIGGPKPGAQLPYLRQPPGTAPKCMTCGGTGRSKMYGAPVSCPTCFPGKWKTELPPPGYNMPGGGFGPGPGF